MIFLFYITLWIILLFDNAYALIHNSKSYALQSEKPQIYRISLDRVEVPGDAKSKFIQKIAYNHKILKGSFLKKESKHVDPFAKSIHELKLGHPSNKFRVIFDTGSANIWINSAKCSDEGCINHKRYDGTKFSSYIELNFDLDVEFGTGELVGKINADHLYVAGVQVDRQPFAEITHEIGSIFAESGFDGIVGLAYPRMAAYGLYPLFDNIIRQRKLENNIFSFYFDSKNNSKTSTLVLGGVDEELFEPPVTYFPVVDKYYWTIEASKILIGDKEIPGVCENGCKVVADTGTTLLTGPSDELEKFLSVLGPEFKCSNIEKMQNITFILKNGEQDPKNKGQNLNSSFILTAKDYMLKFEDSEGGDDCPPAIMPMDVPKPDGPLWILGDVFLSKFYSVYDRDNDLVGFAKAIRK